ncbi:unnamed protein product [Bursaphelenchus okinawaensis]|uniref:Adenylyltransferase and sulfurtransferase MOCS3 homolog n=1 Tax=Bursaphelenchus okinawaensis TaxID=465554 RepID=A0A811KTU5_9BILA|nr:unnamed protein product [Bursaphelenchus okinawaensis]CAG9112398.1 unnamed protein product [Bursaphelenchus okinawaensis]
MFSAHELSKAEVERFSRQLLLKHFGVKGQVALSKASVLIVGAGGLGCPVALYLGASGIKNIGIVDHDKVSLDNLHRQVMHTEDRVGQYKVDSIRKALLKLNSNLNIDVYRELIDSSNATEIAQKYDIIVDCSDNVATRYLVNDLCVLTNKPLVSGSALGWEGQLTVYHSGEECPCYRCIFPTPPPPETVTNCSEGGVLGPITGMIGSLQALEVINLIVKGKSNYAGRLFLFDGLDGRTRTISLRKRKVDCDICGQNPTIKCLQDYVQFCQMGPTDKVKTLNLLKPELRISVRDFFIKYWQEDEKRPLLIDVRPTIEYDICHLPGSKNVPLSKLEKMADDELSDVVNGQIETVFLLCHRGNDSQLAVNIFKDKVSDYKFKDIIGGLDSWATEIDSKFPTY